MIVERVMEQLTDLKAILHSKRANIYYLEYCRVMFMLSGAGVRIVQTHRMR